MVREYTITKKLLVRRAGQGTVTYEEQHDFEEAHAEGLHDGYPREFCLACEGRDEGKDALPVKRLMPLTRKNIKKVAES